MITSRWKMWGATAAAIGAALVLMSPATAAASAPQVTPAVTPAGPTVLCDNNGTGFCLEEENLGQAGGLIHDVTHQPMDLNEKWTFNKVGVTSKSAPFTTPTLDQMITPGRAYGRWTNDNDELCLAYLNGHVVANVCSATGTLWVLSGSGRMITVLHSDQVGSLVFANSSGVNGGHPSLVANGNTCPKSCWGPMAG